VAFQMSRLLNSLVCVCVLLMLHVIQGLLSCLVTLDIQMRGMERTSIFSPNLKQQTVFLIGDNQKPSIGRKTQAGRFILVDWTFQDCIKATQIISGMHSCVNSTLLRKHNKSQESPSMRWTQNALHGIWFAIKES
jgi:hypothetical protein